MSPIGASDRLTSPLDLADAKDISHLIWRDHYHRFGVPPACYLERSNGHVANRTS